MIMIPKNQAAQQKTYAAAAKLQFLLDLEFSDGQDCEGDREAEGGEAGVGCKAILSDNHLSVSLNNRRDKMIRTR